MPKCIPTSIPAPRSTLDGQKITKILQKLNNWRPIGAEIVDFDRHVGALWGQRGLQNLIFLVRIQEKCRKMTSRSRYGKNIKFLRQLMPKWEAWERRRKHIARCFLQFKRFRRVVLLHGFWLTKGMENHENPLFFHSRAGFFRISPVFLPSEKSLKFECFPRCIFFVTCSFLFDLSSICVAFGSPNFVSDLV